MALVELPRRAALNFIESGLAAAIDERISRSRDGVAPARCGRSAPQDCSAVLPEREFPGIAVSLSAEVVPELRQYERAARSSPTPSGSH